MSTLQVSRQSCRWFANVFPRLFTPLLTEFYSDLVTSGGEPFEIVFVSSDKTPEDMMTYMKESHGDWLAVQHATVLAQQLKKKFSVTGIPTLIVVNRRVVWPHHSPSLT